jgi:hypothetical protein
LDAVLVAALEAAAARAGQRAHEVIMAARLATAMHMRRAAEHASALRGGDAASCPADRQAATAQPAVAAGLPRRGGGQ